MPLTATAVRTAKPREKTKRLYDERGLYLEISPRGGKWWRLKYRIHGKEKRLSLGTYPDVGLKDARHRRDEARELIAKGVDPSEFRRRSTANTFQAVAEEWFTKKSGEWAANHTSKVKGRLENDVYPYLGSTPISEVTPQALLTVLRRVEQRDAVETAHRIRGTASQIFRYAVSCGLCDRDIAADLRGALKPVRTQHLASVTDPFEVGKLLRTLDSYQGSLVVRCALRLAPLVFVRPGELRQARWADFDFPAAEWRFESSKTKAPHIVPLSKQAIEILREVEPRTRAGDFVFPSARTRSRPMSDNTINAAMRNLDIPSEQMCGHGFRAMARTLLDEALGFRPDFIEHQLAHAVRDPNGRAYNRTAHLDERRKMMQVWADYLDERRLDDDNVVPIRSVRSE